MKVTIKPQEDARLPILEAEIESAWAQHRRKMYRELKAQGTLQQIIHNLALHCILVVHQYEERGHGADMAREFIWREMIFPPTAQ